MEMIAKCGLICTDCGAYKATLANDNELRKHVSEEWSRLYGAEIKPEDINCRGCLATGDLFSHCKVCEIRLCAIEREVENCAYCDDYGCEKIQKFFEFVPDSKSLLDKIHASI